MPAGPGARLLPLTLIVLSAVSLGFPARGEAPVLRLPDARLEPVAWSTLPGWAADDHAAAFDTFRASCNLLVRQRPEGAARAMEARLAEICAEALALRPARAEAARRFFESRFKPVRIARLESGEGFLTGYYEPIVEGSRRRTAEYTIPVYHTPDDLVPAVRRMGPQFPNSGGVWRQVGENKIEPYYDRAAIEDGALDGKGLEICWLKDPIDAFFMHIQGSARVRLVEDGTVLRLNYAAHNGHPYTPVGAILVQRGVMPKEDVSMDRIREWMQAHPDAARELRRQNRSYIFFRVAELSHDQEAIGGQGVPLTAGRSIAVDRSLHAYGTPFWIDARLPLAEDKTLEPFRRLMIAQDTGSAIVGPARADIYFGAGEEAGRTAGRIRHPGTFVMLVPRALALTAVKQPVPFPPPKPQR